MFCTNCGKQNPNENRFCQYCGTRMEVAQVASAPAAPIAPAPPIAPAAPVAPAAPAAVSAAAAPVNAAPPAPPAAQAAAVAQVPAAAPAAPAPQAMPVDPQPAPQQYAPAPPQPFVRVPTPTPQPAFPEDTIEVDPVVVSPLFADESEGPRVVRSDSAQPIASEPAAPVPAQQPAPVQQPAPAQQPAPVQQPASSVAQPAVEQPSVSASAAIAPSSSDASSSAGLTGLSGIPETPNDAGNLILERENGERLPVTVFPATVGKGSVANVRIANNTAVSRAHLRISRVGGSMMAEDLGSTNHTYLNGERVVEGNPVCLKNGDLLRLGDENIKVEITK